MKNIQMVDLKNQYLAIKLEIDAAIEKVLLDTSFIQGSEVKLFAQELSEFTGSKHVIPCGNGTDALQVAMMALDLKRGDEVILPVHTYVATAEVIALLGLVPVFADVHPELFTLDVGALKSLITTKTRAIVPVHLYGQCADMESILEFAKQNKLFVIEDAAQALGAVYTFSDGKKMQAGTMGHFGTTSFFPSKNLGCYGDGGAIFTDDKNLAESAAMICNHGQRIKYYHEIVGINSRLDTLQAAVLRVKLRYLKNYETSRQAAAAIYDQQLTGLHGLTLPARSQRSSHVFHQYTLQCTRRNELIDHLKSLGVPTMIYYPRPLHLQDAYRKPGFGLGSFPISERLSDEVVSIPIHTEMDDALLEYICSSIRSFFHG